MNELTSKLQDVLKLISEVHEADWPKALDQLKSQLGTEPLGLIRLGDFTVKTLLSAAQTRPEMIKPYAKKRITWPAEISLRHDDEEPYRALLGTCQKSGVWNLDGPIDFAKDFHFKINRRTESDRLQHAAVRAINNLTWKDRHCLDHENGRWIDLCFESFAPYLKWRERRCGTVSDWLVSLGPLNEESWLRSRESWEPVFKRYFWFSYAPNEERKNLVSERVRHDPEFLNDLRKPKLYDYKDPIISHLTRKAKTERQRWSIVKHNLMKRVEKMLLP